MTNLMEMTVFVSVTAILILLFKRLFKTKMSAKWHMWIWALLLVRFLVPDLPQSEISVFNAIPDSPPAAESVYVPVEPVRIEDTYIIGGEDEMPVVALPEKTTHLPEIIYGVWMIGAAALFIYFISVYAVHMRSLKKKTQISDEGFLNILEECKNVLGIKRNVRLILGDVPMLAGIISPKIVMPTGYDDEENKSIIMHELCHLKNNDIFLIWLAAAMLCINWFNPIMWYAFFAFRKDVEVYCDERVLKITGGKKEYASLLLKTALRKNKFAIGTTALQNGEKEVERRIKYIAGFKKPTIIWTAVILVIAIIVGVVCLTNSVQDYSMDEAAYAEYISRPVGSIMADIDYADKEKAVFHYLNGLFVYNFETKQIERSFDLNKLNCSIPQQGPVGLSIAVSNDGKTAVLTNYGPEEEIKAFDDYTINLRNGRVRKGAKKIETMPIAQPLWNTVGGWRSGSLVMGEENEYYLELAETGYVNGIKIVTTDKQGIVIRNDYPFAPSRSRFVGGGFEFVMPTTNIVPNVADYPDISVLTSDDMLGIAEEVKVEDIKHYDMGLSVTKDVYGYDKTIYRNDKIYQSHLSHEVPRKLTRYFIEYPDKPNEYVVLFFNTDAFSESDIDMMLTSFEFKMSPLYESAKGHLHSAFYRIYSPHYEILDLRISNWKQNGNEATFNYTKVDKNYDKDPDTVEYIIEARESGSPHYETYKAEYLMPKDGNYQFKVVDENGKIIFYTNANPKGEEWVPANLEEWD
ncbi:MAG: hypothetical protein IJY55_04720 [Clostridia bacterium]|nr:hypothetical protein [Clostridia bacterium]